MAAAAAAVATTTTTTSTALVRDTVSDLLEHPGMALVHLPDLTSVADDLEAFMQSPEFGEHSAVTRRNAERALRRIDAYLQWRAEC